MKIHQVESSNIAALAWDDGTLFIQFNKTNKAGVNVYSYAGVHNAIFDDMLTSASVGSFFHANVKSAFNATPVPASIAERLGFVTSHTAGD